MIPEITSEGQSITTVTGGGMDLTIQIVRCLLLHVRPSLNDLAHARNSRWESDKRCSDVETSVQKAELCKASKKGDGSCNAFMDS